MAPVRRRRPSGSYAPPEYVLAYDFKHGVYYKPAKTYDQHSKHDELTVEEISAHHDDGSETVAQPNHFGDKDRHPGRNEIGPQQSEHAREHSRKNDECPTLPRR